MENFKNFMLEYLKREILRKQEMEKNWEPTSKRLEKIWEPTSRRLRKGIEKNSSNKKKAFQNYWKLSQKEKMIQAALIFFLRIPIWNLLVNLYTNQTKKSHSEHIFEDMKKCFIKTT